MIEEEIEQVERLGQVVIDYLIAYGFQLAGALVILLIGLFFSKRLSLWLFNLLRRNNVDVTLSKFLANVVQTLLVLMVAIVALGKIGISVTPFVAAIGAASLGAGLALQGMLANYGAGITIIITRPFVVDDTITVAGHTGLVKEVTLASTVLVTEDGEEYNIPNKLIIGDVRANTFANTLIEGSIGVSYQSDLDLVIGTITKVLSSTEGVCQKPDYIVGVDEFADSSINVAYRFWVPTLELHRLKYAVNYAVFSALKQAEVDIPFPQREVTILSSPSAA